MPKSLILDVRLFERRKIRVRVLPYLQKIAVARTGSSNISLEHRRASRAEMRERIQRGDDGLAAMVQDALKLVAGRPAVPQLARPEGAGFSFPSGHATITFASATVLQQHFGWKVGVPAYAVASYVAASRVQMKRHYFSDVVFGAALGIAAGRTATLANGRLLVAPIATPGGAGASFTWRACC